MFRDTTNYGTFITARSNSAVAATTLAADTSFARCDLAASDSSLASAVRAVSADLGVANVAGLSAAHDTDIETFKLRF